MFSKISYFPQSDVGLRAGAPYGGTPYAQVTFETDVILNAMVYTACLINPILYFLLNPDYRKGVGKVWTEMYCNKDPVQVHCYSSKVP